MVSKVSSHSKVLWLYEGGKKKQKKLKHFFFKRSFNLYGALLYKEKNRKKFTYAIFLTFISQQLTQKLEKLGEYNTVSHKNGNSVSSNQHSFMLLTWKEKSTHTTSKYHLEVVNLNNFLILFCLSKIFQGEILLANFKSNSQSSYRYFYKLISIDPWHLIKVLTICEPCRETSYPFTKLLHLNH